MKFIIKHEIPGRIRVHMVQPKMTFEEADILLYYLVNLENVTKAKVYERTQDAVIYYEKDRREIIKALQKFGYDRVTVPEGLTERIVQIEDGKFLRTGADRNEKYSK